MDNKKATAKHRRMEAKKKTDKHNMTAKDKKMMSLVNSSYKIDKSFNQCLVDVCTSYERILETPNLTKKEILDMIEDYTSEFTITIDRWDNVLEDRYDRFKKQIQKE